MSANDAFRSISSDWADTFMKLLPELYQSGNVTGSEDFVFVYTTTFFAAGEKLHRGTTAREVRAETSRLLQSIDETEQPVHDKELFAALVARAVDDAIEGRPPCLLH
jgi:hypothetical protein